MKIKTTILALLTVLALMPVAAHAQGSSQQPCVPSNPYAGQSAYQAAFTDPNTGATYTSAVYVVTGTTLLNGSAINVAVKVYSSEAAAQNSCLQPVASMSEQFTGTAFTTNFGATLTPVSGTFKAALIAEGLAAIKATGPLAAQLANATSITL